MCVARVKVITNYDLQDNFNVAANNKALRRLDKLKSCNLSNEFQGLKKRIQTTVVKKNLNF